MAALEKIENIKKIAKTVLPTDVTQHPAIPGNKDNFESIMLQQNQKMETSQVVPTEAIAKTEPSLKVVSTEASASTGTGTAASKPSLMQEVSELNRKVDNLSRINPNDLVAQAHEAVSKIDELKTKLSTPNLEIKNSVQNLLKNKLSHIDESLKIALTKAGVEYRKPEKPSGIVNPIERFLGFLSDGQYQLNHLAEEVETMHLKKGEISPANMLMIQIKVGFVQQELEFFTSLLNKALESTKTIMNVQV